MYSCICVHGHNLRMHFWFLCRCVRGEMMGGKRTNIWCQQGCMQAHGDKQWHRHCLFILDNSGHSSCMPKNTKTKIQIKAISPGPTIPLSFLSAPNSTAESPQIFRFASQPSRKRPIFGIHSLPPKLSRFQDKTLVRMLPSPRR